MKLTELVPQFYMLELRVETWTRTVGDPLAWKQGDPTEEVTSPREYYVPVTTIGAAQGVMFTCPKCRSHKVMCWFHGRGVADDVNPGPGRWVPRGTGLSDLTLDAGLSGKRSVLLDKDRGGCGAHFYVTDGNVTLDA